MNALHIFHALQKNSIYLHNFITDYYIMNMPGRQDVKILNACSKKWSILGIY
jgi:hypothetical protein